MFPALRRAVARHPLPTFYALSYLFVFALVPFLLLTDWFDLLDAALARTGIELTTTYLTAARLVLAAPETIPAVVIAVLQPMAPTLAALLVAWLAFGRPGPRAVVGRLRPWIGVGWRRGLAWWALAVATGVALSLATAGLNALLLPGGDFAWEPPAPTAAFAAAFLAALFLDGGGVGEEVGWHGFAFPLLQDRLGPLVATLVLGVLWSLWHVPVKIDLLGEFGGATFAGMIALFVLRLALFAVVMSFFYNRLGGSALVCVALHGLHNDSARLQGTIADAAYAGHWAAVELAMILPLLLVAGLMLWGTGGRLGLPGRAPARAPAAPPPPLRAALA